MRNFNRLIWFAICFLIAVCWPETLIQQGFAQSKLKTPPKSTTPKTLPDSSSDASSKIVPAKATAGPKELERLHTLDSGKQPYQFLGFSRDGKTLCGVGFNEGTLANWDLETGQERFAPLKTGLTFDPNQEPAQARTKDLLAVRGQGKISVIDLLTGKVERSANCPDSRGALSFSQGDKFLGSCCSATGRINAFDTSMTLKSSVEMTKDLQHLAFSRGGNALIASFRDGICVWPIGAAKTTVKHYWPVANRQIRFLETNEAVDQLVVGYVTEEEETSYCHVLLWDLLKTKTLTDISIGKKVRSVTITPDWNYAVVGESSGVVSLWDLFTGKMVHEVPAFKEPVLQVVASRTSPLIAARAAVSDIAVFKLVSKKE